MILFKKQESVSIRNFLIRLFILVFRMLKDNIFRLILSGNLNHGFLWLWLADLFGCILVFSKIDIQITFLLYKFKYFMLLYVLIVNKFNCFLNFRNFSRQFPLYLSYICERIELHYLAIY